MKTVHKFPLRFAADKIIVTVEMQIGATIVMVGQQRTVICLWAEVDTDIQMKERTFAIFGTGHAVPDDFYHVGSLQTLGGVFVWHIYEKLL